MTRFEGLLSVEEARACVAAGYDGPWFTPVTDSGGGGALIVAESVAVGDRPVWLWDSPGNDADFFVYEQELLGFAPAPGYFLPMATAPRDGRPLLLRAEGVGSSDSGLIVVRYLRHADAWDWPGPRLIDHSQALGWQPIVLAKEVPDVP